MSNKVRIIAAVLDTHRLTLYKDDGETIVYQQGDHRLKPILDLVVPICKNGGVAEVDLNQFNIGPGFENHYDAVEKHTNGLIRFFKVAKSKVAEFFGKQEKGETKEADHLAPVAAGQIPVTVQETAQKGVNEAVPGFIAQEVTEAPAEVVKAAEEAPVSHGSAIDQILANAQPVSDPAFKDVEEDKESETHTMIAVMEDKVIPNAEGLRNQLANVSITGSSVGLENFMKRIGVVIKDRRHSVEDLMKFMRRGDLPVADDGSIVIYKILRKKELKDHPGFDYVDCHSGNVPQSVGSYVHMDHSLVDHNRRNECSNGLHVARRQYLGNFHGDVCVLAKVAPEDVIAVPEYDANKMRVCGYHILFELPAEAFNELKRNREMTKDSLCAALLHKALRGDHVGVLNKVKITENRGGGIEITTLVEGEEQVKEALKANDIVDTEAQAKAIPNADQLKADQLPPAEEVDANALAKELAATAAPKGNRADQAMALFVAFDDAKDPNLKLAAGKALLDFKKKAKVGWDKLGIDQATVSTVQLYVDTSAVVPEAAPAKATKAKAPNKAKDKPKAVVQPPKAKAAPVKAAKPQTSDKKPVRQDLNTPAKARGNLSLSELYAKALKGDKASAQQVLDQKKAKKKGWIALGLPDNAADVLAGILGK